jgi:hypothetical protein
LPESSAEAFFLLLVSNSLYPSHVSRLQLLMSYARMLWADELAQVCDVPKRLQKAMRWTMMGN